MVARVKPHAGTLDRLPAPSHLAHASACPYWRFVDVEARDLPDAKMIAARAILLLARLRAVGRGALGEGDEVGGSRDRRQRAQAAEQRDRPYVH